MTISKRALRAGYLAAAAFCMGEALSPAAAQTVPATGYDLPSQPLGDTLRAIARAGDREILFAEETVHGRRAPAGAATSARRRRSARALPCRSGRRRRVPRC